MLAVFALNSRHEQIELLSVGPVPRRLRARRNRRPGTEDRAAPERDGQITRQAAIGIFMLQHRQA